MSLLQYAGANYRGGHLGFMAFNLEPSGMIAPEATTLPAGPGTLLFGGYTSVPDVQMPEGTSPVRAAGSARPVAFVPGFRQPTMDANLILGSGANMFLLLRCALRHLATDLVPQASKFHCLPVIAVSQGAYDPCDSTLSYHKQGRHAQINSLSFSIQEGQPVSSRVQIWPVCIDRNRPAITGLNDAAIKAAGGDVFAWQHLEFGWGGTDYTSIISSANFQITNGLRRGPMRTLASVNRDKTNPLYRCTRQVIPGPEDVQVSLNLADKLPESMDGENNIGTLSAILTNDSAQYRIDVETNFVASQGQQGTGAEAPFAFSASFQSSAITLTRTAI